MRASSLALLGASLFALSLAGGCAAPQPLPFRLVDSGTEVQNGAFFPDSQRLEARVDGELYSGFYIVATSVAYSQTLDSRRFFPRDTITTVTSNSARAHLVSTEGRQMNCEILFEARRALGECRTPAGKVYQLIADGQ
ncbi:MAG: hypothetical protein Q7S85_03440 [Rugosibacter sp.]|nr:hypothetical protein [Rugosibacter sp.]